VAGMARQSRSQSKTGGGINRFWLVTVGLLFVLLVGLYFAGRMQRAEVAPVVQTPAAPVEAPEDLPAARTALLFFGTEDAEGLHRELREVRAAEGVEQQARVLVEELLRGPSAEGVLPTLPPETSIRKAYLDAREGVLYLDFSRELRTRHWGGTAGELLTIRSLVTTVASNLPAVKAVQILVEGQQVESLAGHLQLSEPFQVAQWGNTKGDLGLSGDAEWP